ncbi:alpha-L-arabinofuranosidase C-terminal domain-containing protein [Jonesia quinghaiensis]|uniref:alpha-L-arabinofuranosidase C-terminal domain-containing protein n=1 Tax=Jonesia quinghaiensis TaxID=262806 RepID=UPI0003FDD43F|nr:alpha-L-arabinofuranosidase C-terminal domain-containing protein [Jonesia quinghaiensis]
MRVHRRGQARQAARTTAITLVAALSATLLATLPTQANMMRNTPDASVPVVDDFDADLSSQWQILNEDTSKWAVDTAESRLTINAPRGDTYQSDNTAKNIFVMDVPAGDFTAVTEVSAQVATVYQGAGLIAMGDLDNYVRTGLTFVGGLTPSGIAVETDVETAAVFSAADFEDRPNSASETLRIQRSGDTLTSSLWADTQWQTLHTQAVTFDVTQVGLYALGAQDGTELAASFDYFALETAPPGSVNPPDAFTLAPTTGGRLTVTDSGLRVTSEPGAASAIITVDARDGDTFTATVADQHIVVTDNTLTLSGQGTPQPLTLHDAGGGTVTLCTSDTDCVTAGDGAVLTLGDRDGAARFAVNSVTFAEDSLLTIDGDDTLIETSPDLYGLFYEDINYAADGGLYAELIRNRSFEFTTADNASFNALTAWQKVTAGDTAAGDITVVNDDGRLNDSNRNYLTINAAGPGAGIRNIGYNTGITLIKGDTYDFSVWARSDTAQNLNVTVTDASGDTTAATGTLTVPGDNTWAQHTVTLTATSDTTTGRLNVTTSAAGTLALDMVSLFPTDTWEGPVNGKSVLRKDLAEKLDAMNPQFLRFPGGCVTNVGTFKSYEESGYTDRKRTYQWKETIGPVEERATNWNFWGYNQSYGIGYLEYFLLAEDLGAFALPVVSVGANGCGSTIPEMTDPQMIDRWVNDTLDLIEFATGPTDSTWGAIRAELGHPEPFDMPYIGLGNEENTKTFEANFPTFRDAIEERFPDITIISNSGPDDAGTRFDELWDFNREQGVAMVDEHYYNDPGWFLSNHNRYDTYDREGPAVFLGEYASRGNTMFNAVAEASYMIALERNSDIVKLASYAPLFANEDHVQWSPDAIWFNNHQSWVTPNYWVQKMFADNHGDAIVPSTQSGGHIPETPINGGIFLSTWKTAATYDNITVTGDDGTNLFTEDFTDASAWRPVTGTWALADGGYRQSDATVEDARAIITDAYSKDWDNYTLEVEATKESGDEGFLIGFGATASDEYFWWNLGGWNNTRSVLEKAQGGRSGEVKAKEGVSLETGKTYTLRIEVSERTVKLYLDGELHLEYSDTAQTQELFSGVSRDTDTGDLVVKLVNTSNAHHTTTVQVNDVTVGDNATVTTLAGDRGAVNTKATPDNVAPVTTTRNDVGNEFTAALDPYSVTFIRLETQDSTPPAIDLAELPQPVGNGWYAPPLEITATASDIRGVDRIEWRVDNGEWVTGKQGNDTITATVSDHGQHTVAFRAFDKAGNESDLRDITVNVDARAPLSRADINPETRVVTMRAVDEESGLAGITYRVDDGQWAQYNEPVTLAAAAQTITWFATDKAGNKEDATTMEVAPPDAPTAPSQVKVTAKDTRITAGKDARLAVKVTSQAAISGTVTASVGDTPLASAPLKKGTATLKLSHLPVGRHTITVAYSGNDVTAPSTSTLTITVTAKKTSLSVKPKHKAIRAGKPQDIRVKAPKNASGDVTVTVKRGKKNVYTVAATLHKGKVTVELPRSATASSGKYTVTVTYPGDSVYAPADAQGAFTVR